MNLSAVVSVGVHNLKETSRPILLETKGIGLKFFARIEASKYYTLMVTQILHVIVPPNGISGEFGRAMVRVFSRRSRFQILMARANEPDVTKAY